MLTSTDVAGSYAFGTKDFRVDALDFAPAFHVASEKLAKQSHLMKQYPWLLSVSQRLPDKWVSAIDPDLAAIIRFQLVSTRSAPTRIGGTGR